MLKSAFQLNTSYRACNTITRSLQWHTKTNTCLKRNTFINNQLTCPFHWDLWKVTGCFEQAKFKCNFLPKFSFNYILVSYKKMKVIFDTEKNNKEHIYTCMQRHELYIKIIYDNNTSQWQIGNVTKEHVDGSCQLNGWSQIQIDLHCKTLPKTAYRKYNLLHRTYYNLNQLQTLFNKWCVLNFQNNGHISLLRKLKCRWSPRCWVVWHKNLLTVFLTTFPRENNLLFFQG